MASKYYPTADNAAIPVDWSRSTGSTCFNLINETVTDDDTSYIQRDANTAGAGTSAVKVQTPVDNGNHSGWTVNVRAKISAGTGSVTVDTSLWQGNPNSGGTKLGSATVATSSASYADLSGTYSAATIDAITNLADLWVELDAQAVGSSRTIRITQVYLSVPDAVVSKQNLIPMGLA